jgi:catechol 2,3-dioxygenase-like lactoylglutathione lyase family enzyme
MDYQLEVMIVPVSDVDRSLAFYTEQVGFTLDIDYHPSDEFRVVQLTPPGSACSVQIGVGLTEARPGTAHGSYLVVSDLERVRSELISSGVKVSEIRHKSPKQSWQGGFEPGIDPEHGDYASFAELTDLDGNTWTLQERNYSGSSAKPRGSS